MRGFGLLIVAVGIIVMIAATTMDVSVPSGLGRVNNLGLMADRQNYTLIGGVILIAGLLMVIFGRRTQAAAESTFDTRPCPLCAETIKNAAVKCKHCGGDVDKDTTRITPALRFGWVARVICADETTRSRVSADIAGAGFPVVEMHKVGGVAAGAFENKSDAESAAEHLENQLGYAATVMFRDKISGDYT